MGSLARESANPGYRSDVLRQVYRTRSIGSLQFCWSMRRADDRATVGTKPEDVGDQALMRGFEPQFRDFVRGCPCLRTGVDRYDRPQSDIGSSPAVASPPPLHDILSAGLLPGAGSLQTVVTYIASVAGAPTARPIAQMKPASSRAIAVTTRVGRLPRRVRAR